MTNNSKTLDIAQRIAMAMTATGTPNANRADEEVMHNEVIGEVPVHLRHLFNLGTEVEDEVKAAHMALTMAKKRHDLVMNAFSLALQSNAPFDVAQKDYIGVKICPFWQVVGVTHDEASTDMHGMDLGEMFRDVLKGRSPRHSH